MATKTQSKGTETGGVIGRIGGARRLAFYAVVLGGIAISVAIFQIALTLPVLFPVIGQIEPSMAGSPHLLHDVAFFGLIWAGLVGLIAQLYKPERRVAGLQGTLVVFAAFLVTIAGLAMAGDATIFGENAPFFLIIFGPAVLAALLHPAGRELLRTRTAGRFSPVLAGLAVVAAIPLAAYAAGQYGLHWSGDSHAVAQHYAGMVVYSAVIVALALLSSLKPVGWVIPLFTAAGMALVFGVASILYPEMASSVGTMWGGAAVAWAVLFAVVGLLSGRGERLTSVAGDPDVRTR